MVDRAERTEPESIACDCEIWVIEDADEFACEIRFEFAKSRLFIFIEK